MTAYLKVAGLALLALAVHWLSIVLFIRILGRIAGRFEGKTRKRLFVLTGICTAVTFGIAPLYIQLFPSLLLMPDLPDFSSRLWYAVWVLVCCALSMAPGFAHWIRHAAYLRQIGYLRIEPHEFL